MSKERLYGWNGENPVKELGGQALIVFRGLKSEPTALKTGHEWTETIGPELKTRQDPYRVVLYYILILKSKGLIRTNEFDINAVTKNAEVKHGITVKTQATVDERHVIAEPVVQEQPAEVVDQRFWPDDLDVNATPVEQATEN
jgi:hypothetical protein